MKVILPAAASMLLVLGCAGGASAVRPEIPAAPGITRPLVDQTVRIPNAVTFTVGAEGTAPLTYGWAVDGKALAGADGPTVTLPVTDASHGGTWVVSVRNSVGMTASTAVLTLKPGQSGPPVILAGPTAVKGTLGASFQLEVDATGTGPLSYQWMKDGQPIAGATSPIYSVAAATSAHAGTYRVVVKGAVAPEATSADAAVTLANPAGGTWSPAGSLAQGRTGHTATLLPDGSVWVVGGFTPSGPTSTVERFDPATGTWTTQPSLALGRYGHTTTLLADGSLLIAGGTSTFGPSNAVERYIPGSGTRNAGTLSLARTGHGAGRLPDGRVLIFGGQGISALLGDVEVYDPAFGTFTSYGNLPSARRNMPVLTLGDGRLFIPGGEGTGGSTGSATLLGGGKVVAAASLGQGRAFHGAVVTGTGDVLVAGGQAGGQLLAGVERYEVAKDRWVSLPALATARTRTAAALLADGSILVAGGDGVASCERIVGDKVVPAASLAGPRGDLVLVRLKDGAILAVGGQAGGQYLRQAEVYR